MTETPPQPTTQSKIQSTARPPAETRVGWDAWTLSLSLAVTVTLLRGRLQGLFDGATELRHFFDRAIGMTTLAGADAAGYAHGYVRLQLLLAATFFVAFAGLHALRRLFDRAGAGRTVGLNAPEHVWIARLSEFWAALAVYDVLFPDVDLRPQIHLLAFFVVLAFGVLTVRTWPGLPGAARLLGPPDGRGGLDRHWLAATVFWPVPAVFVGAVVLGDRVDLGILPDPLWYVLWAGAWLGLLLLVQRTGERRRPDLLRAAEPWLLVPAALPLANEIHARFRSLDPRTVALCLVAALLALAVAGAFGLPRRRGAADRSSRWTARHAFRLYLPLLVFVVGVLRYHSHRIHLGILDYFHLGEEALPAHQFFRFGTLPILELRLSHTFSDMLWAWLYGLVHGVRELDFLIWNQGLRHLVALLLCYFVLARVASPAFAFLAALFLPMTTLFTSYYAVALLPALFVAGAVRRPTTGRFVALAASLGALLLWRIDFGMVATVAAAGVVALQLLRGPHRRRAAARAAGWSAGALALGLGAVRLVGGPGTFETLAFFFQSYFYRLLTRTRPEVIESYGGAAVAQYYLVPAAAMVYVLYLAVQRLVLRRYVPPWKHLLAFLGIFCLVLSARSMERHSLIESFNPYLAVPLVALLPFLLQATGRRRERIATRAAFLAVVVTASVFALPPAGKNMSGPKGITLRYQETVFQFQRFDDDQLRVRFHDERHRPLIQFLDEVLEPQETFLDVSNAPLLYVLADREFPTYVIPSLLHTSETVQSYVLAELDEYREAGRLPLVVFKQGNSFWDATDGVPNEVRCYRVAEWVYRHYRPAVLVGKYHVWWQRGLDERWPREARTEPWRLMPRPSERLYGAKAEIVDAADDSGADVVEADGSEAVGTSLRLTATAPDAHAFDLFDTSQLPPLRDYADWRLVLELESNATEPMQVFFGFDGGYFEAESHAWILPGDAADGTVELAVPLQDGAERLTDLRFDPPDGSEVVLHAVRIESRAAVHQPLTPEQLAQSFPLGLLPNVWARHDPLRALESTRELAPLVTEPHQLDAHRRGSDSGTLELDLPPAEPGEEGATYLHLRIRPVAGTASSGGSVPGARADVKISYGDPASRFTFDLPPGDEASDHLVRLSTQWLWWSERKAPGSSPQAHAGVEQEAIRTLRLEARRPLVVERVALRSGD